MTLMTRSLLATLAVLVAACSATSERGGDAASAAELAAADVVVVADDMEFIDPPSDLPAGDLTIGIDNQGRAPHDLTFEGDGTIVSANGGNAATGQVTLEPGTYTVYCDVSGHREAGMEFRVDVS